MTEPDPSAHGAETIPHCYRHSDRETYISLSAVWPTHLSGLHVGGLGRLQCPECIRQGQASVRQARTSYGGRIATRPTVITIIIVVNVVLWIIANATARPVGDTAIS